MRLGRSHLVVAVAAVLVLLLGSACVRDERGLATGTGEVVADELPPCPVDALDEATGPVTVELWHAINGKAKETLEGLAADFNASQDEVRVDVRSQGTTYTEVQDAYIQAIAGGRLPGMLHTDLKDLQLLIDTRTILPAQSCFEAEGRTPDVLPSVRNALTIDDVYWPAYANVSDSILYYNQAHFEAAGLDPDDPPDTLDEMEDTARALKAAGISAPLSFAFSPGVVESWVTGVGEEIVNNADGRDGLATTSSFDNPATREVFAWVKRMADGGLLQGFSTGGNDQYLALATKDSSMLIETSTAATTIAAFLAGEDVDTGGAAVPEGGGDLLDGLVPSAGPLPGLRTPSQVQIGGGAFFIPSTNPPAVQAGAWMFASYMQERAQQIRWHTEGSYLPIAKEVIDAPEIQTFWDEGIAGQMLQVATSQLLELDPDRPGPIVGPKTAYQQAIEAALSQVVNQGADPDQVVASTDAALDAILARYTEDNAEPTSQPAPPGG